MTRRSPSRKTRSPRLAKISSIVSPAAASISWSESKNGRASRIARRRPILVLPAPISPTRTTVRHGTKRRTVKVRRSDPSASVSTPVLSNRRCSFSRRAGRVLAYRAAGSSIGETGWIRQIRPEPFGQGACEPRHGKADNWVRPRRHIGGARGRGLSRVLEPAGAVGASREGLAGCPLPEVSRRR